MKKILLVLSMIAVMGVLAGCSGQGVGGSTSDTFESGGFIVDGNTGTSTTCASSTAVTVEGGIITGCQ